jgi:hypothetical protein
MQIEVDYTPAVRPPRIGAASGIALAARLGNAAPPDLTPNERLTLDRVGVAKDRLHGILLERERFQPQRLRPVLQPFGSAWSAMDGALESAAKLPPDPTGRADKAKAMRETVFDDGLAFLQGDATTAWLDARLKLDQIDADRLAAILDEVVGAHHLAAARSATAALGDRLGVGSEPRRVPSSLSLVEAISELSRSIAGGSWRRRSSTTRTRRACAGSSPRRSRSRRTARRCARASRATQPSRSPAKS